MPSPLMLAKISEHIVPLIIDSTEDACAAYDATEKPNGDNFSGPYTFGTGCYGILRSRLERCLSDESSFKLELVNNVIRLTWRDGDDFQRFFIYKVDAATRVPNGACSVKAELRQRWTQCWLTPEMEALALAPDGFMMNLGFDASIEGGLGDITLDRIRHRSRNEYEVETLHRFTFNHDGPGRGRRGDGSLEPERIGRPAPDFDPSAGADPAASE